MTQNFDLHELALDRSTVAPALVGPPRRWWSRVVLPAGLLCGFLAMLVWASRDLWTPTTEVVVVPPILTRTAATGPSGPLFQAPGWLEPRPRPTVVTALTEGVIEQLFVVDGQDVAKGEPIAQLNAVDARLTLEHAESERLQRLAELALAQAELEAAKARADHPVHLDAQVAEAESALARAETEKAKLPALIEVARVRLRFAEQDLAGKREAQNAVSERLVQQSQSHRDSSAAELSELESRGPLLDREIQALRDRAKALGDQRRRLVEEKLGVANAEAGMQLAMAALKQSEVAVQVANVRLDRTTVVAPVAGRILQVVARPGTRVMGLSPNSSQEAATVVTLYDPAMLQVRVDVRLEDIPNVFPGQLAKIETASSKDALGGSVLHATSSANIQKNTLEVKVAIDQPPPAIRPEMLARVTFYSPPTEATTVEAGTQRVLAPKPLFEGDGEQAACWIVDNNSLARRRTVRLGEETGHGLIEVLDGLQPTDRLISSDRSGLADGRRVRVTREDATLGVQTQ